MSRFIPKAIEISLSLEGVRVPEGSRGVLPGDGRRRSAACTAVRDHPRVRGQALHPDRQGQGGLEADRGEPQGRDLRDEGRGVDPRCRNARGG